jgi:Flp pilus assembly protein TadG
LGEQDRAQEHDVTNARGERGAAAVEFALVLPLLVLLVFGITEFGRVYYVQTTISGAAREGARAMALQNSPTGARAAAQSAAPGLGLSAGQISVTTLNPLGSTCPTNSTGTGTTTQAKVTITYPMTFVTGLFGPSITLHGTGVMRCNG